jgi:hypothetical protein
LHFFIAPEKRETDDLFPKTVPPLLPSHRFWAVPENLKGNKEPKTIGVPAQIKTRNTVERMAPVF